MGQYCNCYIEILFSFSLCIDFFLKKSSKKKKSTKTNERMKITKKNGINR
jgi:hypothetical protein